MWSKRIIGEQTFLCYNDNTESIAIDETATDHFLYARYLTWLTDKHAVEPNELPEEQTDGN